MEVLLLGTPHHVEESYRKQGEILADYKPDIALLELLPSGAKMEALCAKLNAGKLTLPEFMKGIAMDQHWGPVDCCVELFKGIRKAKAAIAPLDHTLE